MTVTKQYFRDRREAGQMLARDLAPFCGSDHVTVLGLARGGVPVGWEIARALHVPLDVCLVRKLGVPQSPELAMGAVATGGGMVLNTDLVRSLGIGRDAVDEAVARETAELRRREHAYRSGRGPLELAGRTVVLVDDGIATGASMVAAVRSVRQMGAEHVIVGVPVGPGSVCRELRDETDALVCSRTPTNFRAVGQAFEDFHQVSDDEVRALLAAPR